MIFARRRYSRDNNVYLLAEGPDAALVDPGDAAVALGLARDHGVEPRHILHTHGHPDHSGGSRELSERLGAEVLGHAADAPWFRPGRDLGEGGEMALGALRLRVHLAPGHTPGSVLYEWRGRLLTGDTLFWGGSGNCRNGGDPRRLAETFLGALSRLDGALEVHPGHDYAERNLPFVLDLEPGNEAAARRLEEVRAARLRGAEPRAVSLAQERSVNPFLRAADPGVEEALRRKGIAAGSPAAAFLALRRLRDAW